MFKRMLMIPNVFGQESITRRQMLNILLIGITFVLIQGLIVLLLNYKNLEDWHSRSFILITILNAVIVFFIIVFIFLSGINIANRTIRDAQRNAAISDAILNNIVDGVLVLNSQGDFLSANPALLGMIPEIDIKQVILKPLQNTLRWKHKVFSVSVSEVPEIGTVAVFRDETSRYEIERARDDLLATASHELRTPLTAVMNYLEFIQVLIRTGKINTDEFNEHVARAHRECKTLTESCE